ncbi:MAG: ATP-binding protein [Pseudomonadota bacterium]
MNKTKKSFRPKARILELLGEQLIKSHTLALFEIIKNSYDADAEKVTLVLLDVDKSDGAIEVQDDGFGMDFDTVVNIWMEPAHGHKLDSKEKGKVTPKLRTPVGEKGVGRFAAHRLGTHISMVSRMKNKPEVIVEIDWTKLQKHEYLDEAFFEIHERKPEVFKGKSHGTRIIISGLKEKWRKGEVRRLYRSVISMTSPKWGDAIVEFDKLMPPRKDVFNVDFIVEPNNTWLDGLITPQSIREQAMFFYDFIIDSNGFHWRYSFKPLEGLKNDFKKTILFRDEGGDNDTSFEFFKLTPPLDGNKWREGRKDRKVDVEKLLSELGIGPIRGRLAGFDLDKEILSRYILDTLGLTQYLKQQGGMRVYRDGMRVYDYGEEGNDWLGLDHRRFQQPTKKLSNNLILGEIHLNLNDSAGLVEKTNREGFRENKAYEELRYAILCALSRFEIERNKDKNIIRDSFRVDQNSELNPKGNSPEDAINILKQKVLEKRPHKDLIAFVNNVETSYKETRDVLMSAVGSGLGLTTVFHEIERGVRGLYTAIENEASLSKLLEMAKSLNELLKGATFLVSKHSSETLKASELVKYALFSTRERFDFHNIQFKNGFDASPKMDFKIKGVRRMYTAALVNLIDNAIHWVKMGSNSKNRKDQLIWIGPNNDLEGPAIIIADSGTGFEDSPEEVVQPFFTRRSEGMGIGLYYCNMVMKSHGGRLVFPENNDVDIPKLCSGGVVGMVFKGSR